MWYQDWVTEASYHHSPSGADHSLISTLHNDLTHLEHEELHYPKSTES